jgi:hypothetical protein
MNGMSTGKIAVPVGLAAATIGGALGYVWGCQDALAGVWNLRGVAECLEPPETNQLSFEEPVVWSRWVWKRGEHAGQLVPAGRWVHGPLSNPLRGVPVLGALGERLERAATMDIAHGGWTYPRGDPRRPR